jgi:UDP-glucose 4-epimerase
MSVFPRPYGSGVVFVTGAGGFIATHATAALLGAGWRVAGFGHRQSTIAQSLCLPTPDRFVSGALTCEALVRTANEFGWPEIVIHAAGGATVAASLSAPEDDFSRNVGSVREVLAFLQRRPKQTRFIFPSSAAVYGEAGNLPITEAAPTAPLSPYGKHKLLAEDLIREATEVEASIVRFFSVYGPGNRKQLLWDIARRLCAGSRRLELYGSGMEVRDFLFVEDAVALIGCLAALRRDRLPPIVNGGSGLATTVMDLADQLSSAIGIEAELVFTGRERPGDPRRLVSDPSLARSLGFLPKTDLSTGLTAFADWVRKELHQKR